MADLYQNFAFCQATSSIAAGDTTIVVDDVTTLPSNASLGSADFWMVIESTLVQPASFEVVKLTNVNTGTKTLTVTRAQDGTSAVSHASGVYLKGALTSGMLTRLSGGGSATRATATATTSSIASGASDSTTTITLANGYDLYSIQTSLKARVRLYVTAASRTADLSRQIGTDPLSSAGVVLDYVTAAANTTYSLSPIATGANLETIPTTSISMTVTNQDTSTGAITVTLVWLKTE